MNELVHDIARRAGLAPNVAWVLIGLGLALAAGSLARGAVQLRPGAPRRRDRLGSLATWWALFALLVLIALLGEWMAVILFAAASLLGLREYRLLARQRMAATPVWWRLAYVAVPLHYLMIPLEWFRPFWTFIP